MISGPRITRSSAAFGLLLSGACTMAGPPPAARPEPVRLPPVQVERPPVTEAAPPARGPVPAFRPVRTFEEVRGLWVVRSTMTSEQEVRDMVDRAASAGFNTLIVQVRGRADAFYLSSLEPRAETVTGPPDFDPLALAIEEGHRRGLAVHAWVNVHLVWGPGALPESPRHLVNEHPDWLAVPEALALELHDVDPFDSRYVEALGRYARERSATVEGLFSSPSHPEVQERVHAVWMDLVERYDLDGIHFDYVRFPSNEFDYSRGALERFRGWVTPRLPDDRRAELERAADADPLAFVRALPEPWDEFRRAQITGLVERLSGAVKARRPEVVVSAAVIADVSTAYTHRFQDWPRWLAEGILDVAVPMAYTPDDRRFETYIRTARDAAGERARLWAGIGVYLDTFEGTLRKIDRARGLDAGGVVLFSYDWATGEGRGDPQSPFLTRVGSERFGSR